MKIDAAELNEIAAGPAVRMDMYTGIHKAIRAFMADTLLAVGRMDVNDELEFAQVTQRVLELMDLCRSHLNHENRFVHAAMEARAPGSSSRISGEHVEHEHHIAQIAASVGALRGAPVAAQPYAAAQLYRELAVFVAENFLHMNVEETQHNAVLWAHFSDAELMDIHGQILVAVPPAEMMAVLRWMVPFMNPAERAEMLAGMRANAPAPAFRVALDTVRPHLTAREWEKLVDALGAGSYDW